MGKIYLSRNHVHWYLSIHEISWISMCFQELAVEISDMEIQIFQKKIEAANEMVDVDGDL